MLQVTLQYRYLENNVTGASFTQIKSSNL